LQSVIWSLRVLYVGGAFIGWRAGRPHWFYPWLGFASYAAVAALLQFALRINPRETAGFSPYLGFLPILLAFSPYFVTALLVGWPKSRRLLGAYTVFPHAALIIPLFQLVEGDVYGSDLLFVTLSAAGAAVFATLYWRPPAALPGGIRNWPQAPLLFLGVAVSNLLFVLGYGYGYGLGRSLDILIMLVPIVGFSWLVLSGPLLLPPLVQWLLRVFRVEEIVAPTLQQFGRIPLRISGAAFRVKDETGPLQSVKAESNSPKGEVRMSQETVVQDVPETRQPVGSDLDRPYKLSVIVLAALAVLLVALYVGRAAVYKIHEFERGLHLRGGRFLGVQNPGWHVQVPLVDTVIIVKVIERLGYVERIPAMTSDNVTMDVSLQFTYRVTNPERFALAVDDPERIVFEFVQGRLRDVINTKTMTGVMNQRTEMNLEIMQELKEKEDQYGVEFMTVQIQSASPPAEVLSAIKDRMVAAQRQEQAEAEAAQQRTVADAQFYAAQKEAEAAAYRISTTAAAEAEQIQLTTEAQQLAVRAILSELEGKGALAEKYIDYLIAVELKENSKWILGTGAEPILELRPSAEE
ncbi:MAG: SPFH domain-containing protein, partial [Caldilineaceae bacterium SB0675_bin_29]|nr:SPFH domain-containing protein [Caldilineaceae bacterium SB0675_bin_29]